jgi:hypothetical protein
MASRREKKQARQSDLICVTSTVLHFYIFHLTSEERCKQSEQRNVTHLSSLSFLKCSEKKEEHDCFGVRCFHPSDEEYERRDKRMKTGV